MLKHLCSAISEGVEMLQTSRRGSL